MRSLEFSILGGLRAIEEYTTDDDCITVSSDRTKYPYQDLGDIYEPRGAIIGRYDLGIYIEVRQAESTTSHLGFTQVPRYEALISICGILDPSDHLRDVWCKTMADALEFLRLYGPIAIMMCSGKNK